MSNDSKRIFTFVLLAVLWFFAVQIIGDRLGWNVKPKPAQPQPQVAAEAAAKPDGPAGANAKPAVAAVPGPKVDLVKPTELLLAGPTGEADYWLSAQLAQDGGGVEWIELANHEAERETKKADRKLLKIVQGKPGSVPSFALEAVTIRSGDAKEDDEGTKYSLAGLRWDVVRDERGRVVRPQLDPKTGVELSREVAFRTSVGNPAVTITKTFRLHKKTDGLELDLAFETADGNQKVAYWLDGPRGLPIEGEWYTSVFRDVFMGSANGEETQVETRAAGDIVGRAAPEVFETLPIRYFGVENQYFAVFLEPVPGAAKGRVDERTVATIVDLNLVEKQKSDVSVEMTSREINLAAGRPVDHKFRIFSGPKTIEALTPYGAQALATYRKTAWYFSIPGASFMAQRVITPLLVRIYSITATISRAFGGQKGNYGIAIILLTITVRMILFPLSRKQAISAKRMQDLQPKLMELKEKYGDDKEKITKETFALYKKHNIRPFFGCLLGVIQLPIFVGLWQALNNSVALRHAPFLWIDNLAAPDMLFKFPFVNTVPLLGPYFNLLPFAVVALMILQMKLFTPPATNPEQEMQQKIMKFMMVGMSFMFYKVPSGLGIYFITSSTWAICERLLLPKMVKSKPIADEDDADGDRSPAKLKPGGGNGNGAGPKPGGFRDRWQQLIEEAQKDRTHRNEDKERDRDWGRGGKPRPKPPGRKR